MRSARAVTVGTVQGGYSLFVGSPSDGSPDSPIIEHIYVYIEEYPDHTECIVKCFSDNKLVRELWNCPVDIVYLNT
jgi:hypothetical protein